MKNIIALPDCEKGDFVYLDCYSSMGASSRGINVVKAVKFKFDEDTGERYKLLKINDNWYDSRDGTNESMYYIEPVDNDIYRVRHDE